MYLREGSKEAAAGSGELHQSCRDQENATEESPAKTDKSQTGLGGRYFWQARAIAAVRHGPSASGLSAALTVSASALVNLP